MEYWVELRGPTFQYSITPILRYRVTLMHVVFRRRGAGFFVVQQFYLL
jgi:hypothetical protein